jgi:glyoxylase-like metal-dependent hydrolase (beta-lactamase superfamily II)/rhodanese-related sulfurtransferase
VVDAGLGNSAYVVDLGEGRGLAVDASRDLRALRAVAGERGLTVAFAADTHLHADFLSGSRQLGADGAAVLAAAAGRRDFPHRAVDEGDDVDLGGLLLRALATPGHTDEHLAYVLLDGSAPLAVFTGGSLIVGAAARTDLVDPSRTEELARAQYRSVSRLLDLLPDSTPVYPTHGAGSFCAAPQTKDRTTTLGRERATNPLLAAKDEDEFVARLLAALGSFPPYFLRLAEINRRGPGLVRGAPALAQLGVRDVLSALDAGAQLIDVRTTLEFAQSHIPGAVSIELRDAFATWLGWLADPARPIVFVRDPDQDAEELIWQALKIGLDAIAGELTGGMVAWRSAGQPVSGTPLVGVDEVGGSPVLDIRQDDEFSSGHIPGATHVELGALAADAASLPAGPIVVMCGHGERAMTAASLLERHGRRHVAVLQDAGAGDWSKATGRALEVS